MRKLGLDFPFIEEDDRKKNFKKTLDRWREEKDSEERAVLRVFERPKQKSTSTG